MPDLEHDDHLDTTDEELDAKLAAANAQHASRELTPAELRSIVDATPPEQLKEVLDRAIAERAPTQPTAAAAYVNNGLVGAHNNSGR